MWGRLLLLAGMLLFNSQCGGRSDRKVAKLSFADNTKLEKEVGKLFEVVVNIKDIDIKNIDTNDISSSKEGLKQDDLQVTLRVTERGKEKDILAFGRHSKEVIKKSIENGKAKYEGYHFKETCVKDCRIVVGLGINYGQPWSDGERMFHVIEQVDKISKQIVVTESSYVMQVEKLSGNNIKLTITNNGTPLANSSALVDAEVPCLEYGWHGHFCVKPRDTSLFSKHSITLDANGSWSTELDADDSWQAEQGEDYQFNVCDVTLRIKVDNRILEKKLAGSKGCN